MKCVGSAMGGGGCVLCTVYRIREKGKEEKLGDCSGKAVIGEEGRPGRIGREDRSGKGKRTGRVCFRAWSIREVRGTVLYSGFCWFCYFSARSSRKPELDLNEMVGFPA